MKIWIHCIIEVLEHVHLSITMETYMLHSEEQLMENGWITE